MARRIDYYLEHPDEVPTTKRKNPVRIPLTMRERFAQYMTPGLLDECWKWRGSFTGAGYGMINLGNQHIMAHRVSFVLAGGALLDPIVLHDCDNPPCVNPAHLRNGTQGDNMRDMMAKGRGWQQQKTCCRHGHPFVPENMLSKPNGSFQCLTCHKAAVHRAGQKRYWGKVEAEARALAKQYGV